MSRPQTESETTETEFSGTDTGKNEVRFRGQVPPSKKKESSISPKRQIDRKVEFAEKSDEPDTRTALTRSMPVAVNLKKSNFKERTIWTIAMLGGFITFILAGHIYCSILILLVSIGMVREIINLKRSREKDNKVFSLGLCWYFFFVASYYFYGQIISNKLAKFVLRSQLLRFLVNYHYLISFMLWIGGFLFFVLTLKKGFYRYQFRQFGWAHICVVLIVGQTSAIMNNIFEGLVWFILPALLVIMNDIFAYIFGIKWGKTPLIELSPKKTWEGFIGGFFSTLVFAFTFSYLFPKWKHLVCPQTELVLMPFDFLTCEPSTVFELFEYTVPLIGSKIWVSEFQIHALIISLFVSLVSPFGGFFASGFKRAIKVKDFADIIPGHGGVTDRMDCQIITGTFAYLYVHQLVLGKLNSLGGITRYIMTELTAADQLAIYLELEKALVQSGVLNATVNALA